MNESPLISDALSRFMRNLALDPGLIEEMKSNANTIFEDAGLSADEINFLLENPDQIRVVVGTSTSLSPAM